MKKEKRKKIMKPSKNLTITAVILALALSANNFASAKAVAKASAKPATFNVAVVDVQKVVANSPQISALKTEQKNKLADLASFVEKAKADIAQEKNDTKKKSLEEGYNKELNVRKSEIDKDAAKRLLEIDKSIQDTIKAKSANYDLVLTKSSVLNGGTDITNEIIKSLK